MLLWLHRACAGDLPVEIKRDVKNVDAYNTNAKLNMLRRRRGVDLRRCFHQHSNPPEPLLSRPVWGKNMNIFNCICIDLSISLSLSLYIYIYIYIYIFVYMATATIASARPLRTRRNDKSRISFAASRTTATRRRSKPPSEPRLLGDSRCDCRRGGGKR